MNFTHSSLLKLWDLELLADDNLQEPNLFHLQVQLFDIQLVIPLPYCLQISQKSEFGKCCRDVHQPCRTTGAPPCRCKSFPFKKKKTWVEEKHWLLAATLALCQTISCCWSAFQRCRVFQHHGQSHTASLFSHACFSPASSDWPLACLGERCDRRNVAAA